MIVVQLTVGTSGFMSYNVEVSHMIIM